MADTVPTPPTQGPGSSQPDDRNDEQEHSAARKLLPNFSGIGDAILRAARMVNPGQSRQSGRPMGR